MKSHSAIGYSYDQILEALGLTDVGNTLTADEIINDPNKLQLVREYLAKQKVSSSILDAHRWILNWFGDYPRLEFPEVDIPIHKSNDRITEETHVWHPALLDLLEQKCIPLYTYQSFFKQARIYDSGTKNVYYALTHKNDGGGIVITASKEEQSVIGDNDITFIGGSVYQYGGLHIFKGVFDYLAALQQVNKGIQFKNDTIILNFYSNLNKTNPFLKKYEYRHLYMPALAEKERAVSKSRDAQKGYKEIYTWMPNDDLGKQVTKSLGDFLKTELSLTHIPMNPNYAGYRDVSAFHSTKYGLIG